MSRALAILQVDAFTRTPLAGNPAGVVLDAAGLSEAEMRAIAAEIAAPETGFLTPAAEPGADFGLRWFTASGAEVTFCGHATVAVVHALAEAGRLAGSRVTFRTLGGLLPATLSPSPDGPVIWLEPAPPRLDLHRDPPEKRLTALREALGLRDGEPGDWAPLALTPERDLLIPVAGLHVLKSLAPDLPRVGALGRAGAIRGFCLVARGGFDPGSLTHSRFFAPHYGIPEDPVTGSVHASLAVWLWQAGVLAADSGVAAFGAEQGDFLGRPGRLQVELHLADGRPARVRVGGHAVTALAGTLKLP